jgi:hypothetical protein
MNMTQCNENDLGNTKLINECGIYNEICKTKCSKLTSETNCNSNSRDNDCIWLLENTTKSIKAFCEDKVFIYQNKNKYNKYFYKYHLMF